MGFRSNSYATVWEVESKSDACTTVRMSISKKDRDTGEYITDFSGFVKFLGTQVAQKALKLKEKDRIKLGETDVSTSYDSENKKTYTTYKVFSFELTDDTPKPPTSEDMLEVANNVEDGFEETGLPF